MKLSLFLWDTTLCTKCVMALSCKPKRTSVTNTLNINKSQGLFSGWKVNISPTERPLLALHTRPLMICGLRSSFRIRISCTYHALLLSTHQLLITFQPLTHCLLCPSFSLLGHQILTSFKALIKTYYNCFHPSLKGWDYPQFLIPGV